MNEAWETRKATVQHCGDDEEDEDGLGVSAVELLDTTGPPEEGEGTSDEAEADHCYLEQRLIVPSASTRLLLMSMT